MMPIKVGGDLNAYAMEDPITLVEGAGYTDLVESYIGSGAYSYVYYGQAGYLDHVLGNNSLAPQVTDATTWPINADEPWALEYNEEYKSPGQVTSLYSDDPYRSSDHDPVIVGLQLGVGLLRGNLPVVIRNAVRALPLAAPTRRQPWPSSGTSGDLSNFSYHCSLGIAQNVSSLRGYCNLTSKKRQRVG